jgi:hypothetical protein
LRAKVGGMDVSVAVGGLKDGYLMRMGRAGDEMLFEMIVD